MSIKIYNGYRIPAMSIAETLKWIKPCKDTCQEHVVSKYKKDIVDQAYGYMDSRDLGLLDEEITALNGDKIKTNASPIFIAWQYIVCAQEMVKLGKGSLYNYNSSVVIIPCNLDNLALLYYSDNEIVNIWESHDEVERFGYWNNTDKPDELTDDQWSERERIWSPVFDNAPIDVGMTIQLSNADRMAMFPSPAEISKKKLMPSIEKRVENFALGSMFNELKKGREEKKQLISVMAILREAKEHEKYSQYYNEYKDKLIKFNRSPEDLFN